YHLVYDLDTFGGYGIESTSGFWANFADATASAFLLLVGISLAISYLRASAGGRSRNLFGKFLRRGLRIFAYGMALTAVFFVLGMGAVVFGILHLIGVSIILAYPFLVLKLPNVALGFGCIALGLYLNDFSVAHPWLAWLGIRPNSFMLDYWPILPWFGVTLLGVFVGNALYGEPSKRTPHSYPAASRPLAFLGRHSLPVYLVHQPVLLAALILLGFGDVGIP
ncbi:MAG: DUF1624 domain-containing protein, partial [Actinomycetota bacterium]|nr:DUF1624 domain-containing protein [Actinomycetota bacterium]